MNPKTLLCLVFRQFELFTEPLFWTPTVFLFASLRYFYHFYWSVSFLKKKRAKYCRKILQKMLMIKKKSIFKSFCDSIYVFHLNILKKDTRSFTREALVRRNQKEILKMNPMEIQLRNGFDCCGDAFFKRKGLSKLDAWS